LKTHYELLGLERSAVPDEIKRAFRREIAKYHPDKVQHLGQEFQDIASTRAAELTEAYRILMDPAAREKYDANLGAGTLATDPAPSRASTLRAEAAGVTGGETAERVPEAYRQTRATLSEFVRKATLARILDAAEAACDAAPVTARGFDAAYTCRTKRGLFKKAEPELLLLVRLVGVVDAASVEECWPLALKALGGNAAVCMMLVGQGMAPATALAGAVADLRRKSRNPGPILVPVDFRDWEALFPPDTPAVVRDLVERLRHADR
jgi:DnaJ domain